jgi:radical SAM protein with 4Fe4S-binding SPASM domain
MAEAWRSGFSEFRDYAAHAPEPCASCEYLRLCNGGCRAVGTPDPGCPRVQEHRLRLPLPVVAG